MDRRFFLGLAGATVSLIANAAGARPLRKAAQRIGAQGDAALDRLFDRIFNDSIRRSPTGATSLGLDKGALAGLRSKFDTRPPAIARAQEAAFRRRDLAALRAVDPRRLTPANALNREIVIYDLETGGQAARFGIDSVMTPYLITQQGGAYFEYPDFLDSSHPIATTADAEAYLSRLSQLATVMDLESAEQRAQARRGFVAPAWSIDLVLKQMAALRAPSPRDSGLTQSLFTRTAEKGIAGNWQARAERIVAAQVYPALDRQIAMMRGLRRTTPAGDGAWRLPRGNEIYAAALAQATTTTLTPDEVHQLGLSQVAEISAQLDTILRGAGYTKGSVGERLQKLNTASDQLYPETDAGRTALIASLNAGTADMMQRLPRAFATLPNQPLEIRRVPPEIQDGASNGYYRRATLDGSRPAIYFINLKSTADWSKYALPALTYHEGVPGHHLQISLAQTSAALPMIRKVSGYSSYSEGWALYAEQLADELGAYKGIERAGYLQSYLFRASRLVVDTGLHHKRWSREQAVEYMTGVTGFPRARVQREVERYCVLIGQACSYKVGHLAWVRARAAAQQALGAKFDIKQFHEVLKDGAMPLTILERRIAERTAQQLAAR